MIMILVGAVTIFGNVGAQTTRYVDDDYPPDDPLLGTTHFTSVQSAIDYASSGDTIIVYDGTYYENVLVDKSVVLNSGESAIIDGGGTGSTVNISASNVELSGFEITGSGSGSADAGLKISSNHNTVKNNLISGNHIGITLPSGGVLGWDRSWDQTYSMGKPTGTATDGEHTLTVSASSKIVKRNSGNGNKLWEGTFGGLDAQGVAWDSAHNFAVVGQKFTGTTNDWLVEYYDGENHDKKISVLAGFSGSFVQPRDCEFDSSDNLFVVGQGGSYYSSISKFDLETGTVTKTYHDNEITGSGYFPYYLDLCIDSADNVYVAGKIAGSEYRSKVVKFDNNLNDKWYKTPGSANSEALAIDCDDSDGILVGVYDYSVSKTKLYKYNSSGKLEWKDENFGSDKNFRINQKSIASFDGDCWVVGGYSSTDGVIFYFLDADGNEIFDTYDTDITQNELQGDLDYDEVDKRLTLAYYRGSNNGWTALWELSATGASMIYENVITANDLGISLKSADVNIKRNIISGNTEGVKNSGAEIATLEFNWWGDATGPSGEGPGSGDSISTNIDYSPWLGAMIGMAPMTFITDDAIQSAVSEALDGDTVIIKSGSYSEQVIINKALTLKTDGHVKLTAPAVRTSFSIAGSGHTWDPLIFAYGGILSENHVSGSGIIHVRIEGIETDGLNDSKNSMFTGILLRNVMGAVDSCVVYSMGAPAGIVQETYGIAVLGNSEVTVAGNDISGFNHGGIVFIGDGKQPSEPGDIPDPHGIIDGNTVTGTALNDQNLHAEKGIMLSGFASGTVTNNYVKNCRVGEPLWGGAGILCYFGIVDDISENSVENCDLGIALYYNRNGKVYNNVVTENDFGFDVVGGSANEFHHNSIESNIYSGMYVNSDGNIIHHNSYDYNGDSGLLLDGADNNQLSHNKFNVNDAYGIYVYASESNNFEHNSANRNGVYGMSLEGSDNNQVKTNRFFFNDYFGISLGDIMDHYDGEHESAWGLVETSDGNTISSNIAQHNGDYDLRDVSRGINNRWSNNVYATSDPAGLSA